MEWGWSASNKVRSLIEDDLIKSIMSQINSFIEYQTDERNVIGLGKYADEVEVKAKERKQALSSFDFADLEKMKKIANER